MTPPPFFVGFPGDALTAAQGAVVFLRDAAHREHIVFKPLPGGSEVYHRKGQQEHSLVAALQVGEQLGGVLGKGNEVRRQNLHVDQ